MQQAGLGLTEVPTDELKALFRLVHQKRVPVPLEKTHLLAMGFNRLADNGGEFLVGLNESALRAFLTCILAERIQKNSPRP